MSEHLKPRDAQEVEAAVRWALTQGKSLEVLGQGSKRSIGRPPQTALTLDVSALSGVTLYEPRELVLTAPAGTPLVEIDALLAANGQQLAFEPMDCTAILGGAFGKGSIGGVLAASLAGPRRLKAGSARDHFLGVSAVSGRGETFKSGGRVVKNVTGYDLCKLMAGSWGTLAVMTEVTLKTLPKPETEETLLIAGLEPPQAVTAMTAALGSAADVSGAAHLPAGAAAELPAAAVIGSGVTALRLEGFAPSVRHRKRMLEDLAGQFGEVAAIGAAASNSLWQGLRDAVPFAAGGRYGELPLWRISVPPSRGAEIGELLARQLEAHIFYDWAGGLIWAAVAGADDGGAALIRRVLLPTGGHATLIRAPAALRAAVDVFEPLNGALAALTKRLKESFDPQAVLNPGRMWATV